MTPPAALEHAVGWLIPPSCREEVLGDLHERYSGPLAYVGDAARALPLVIAAKVRRTSDPAIALMEGAALYLSFLAAVLIAGRLRLSEPWLMWRLAGSSCVGLGAMLLRDVYVSPGKRLVAEPLFRAAIGAAVASLASPPSTMVWGGVASIVLLTALRILFPPVHELPQGAGGAPLSPGSFWSRYGFGELGLGAGHLLAIAAVAALIVILPIPPGMKPKALGLVLVSAVLLRGFR